MRHTLPRCSLTLRTRPARRRRGPAWAWSHRSGRPSAGPTHGRWMHSICRERADLERCQLGSPSRRVVFPRSRHEMKTPRRRKPEACGICARLAQAVCRRARTTASARSWRASPPERTADRVHLIQQLHAAGLPSRTIVDLLPCVTTGLATQGMLDQIITERDNIAARVDELRQVNEKLDRVIAQVVSRHRHRWLSCSGDWRLSPPSAKLAGLAAHAVRGLELTYGAAAQPARQTGSSRSSSRSNRVRSVSPSSRARFSSASCVRITAGS